MTEKRYNFAVSAVLSKELQDGRTEVTLRTGLSPHESEEEAIGAFTMLVLHQNNGASLRIVSATKIPWPDAP